MFSLWAVSVRLCVFAVWFKRIICSRCTDVRRLSSSLGEIFFVQLVLNDSSYLHTLGLIRYRQQGAVVFIVASSVFHAIRGGSTVDLCSATVLWSGKGLLFFTGIKSHFFFFFLLSDV